MFGQSFYAFTEDGVVGEILVTASAPAPFNFSFSVNGGELLYTLEEFWQFIINKPLLSHLNVSIFLFVCLSWTGLILAS